ncbi:MAG: MBOAT family protein [Salibacteraceae bacterium]|nr:MBOAT family protein [Salibacteraceae bacterium]
MLVFTIGRILNSNHSLRLLQAALFIVIALFSIRNYPYLHDNLSTVFLGYIKAPILSVQKLGLSYIIFRYIHYLVESYKNKISEANLLTFLSYILFFPSILAGPIDTYRNFQYWLKRPFTKYNKSLFFAGITRIFLGAFKTLAIVPLIINYALDYKLLLSDYSPFAAISLSMIAYSAYIYIDFSGYSDIAIGTAFLLGIKTPENFNNPYFSSSLSEFWKRWHITFSNFLKIYVFKPIISMYNKVLGKQYKLTVTILGYITTFAICGLWHGDKINFLYWGIWHGIGLALNKVWFIYFRSNTISKVNVQLYKGLSIIVTFLFVTVGWTFFNYTHEQLIEIYKVLV